MKSDAPSYRGHRLPAEIIGHAVWLYHRFCLSFRDVEDLLAQRGITVSYEAIRFWCFKFGPEYARSLKRRQGSDLGTPTKKELEKAMEGHILAMAEIIGTYQKRR